ncbi:MAG: glycosyltransferase family 4 protein [Bacteroidetes bacterium]|nr:glycosyltransferase family 4 protein [Bacteroidota bacterium]
MKIAFITLTNGIPFGSCDLLFYKSAELALANGHKVFVSVFDWKEDHSPKYYTIELKGAILHKRKRYERIPNILLRNAEFIISKFQNSLKESKPLTIFNPDVICINNAGTYDIIGHPHLVEIIEKLNRPYIIISQYHDENYSLDKNWYIKAREFFQNSTFCVFVSERNRESARRVLALPLNNSIVLNNPANLTSHDYLSFPVRTQDNPVKMLSVARLEAKVKGQDIIISILGTDRWKDRNWIFEFWGSGPDLEWLKDLVSFYNLNNRVFFRGYSKNIGEIWKDAEILLLCSTGEGKPLALTEAMFCGRPSIVTDVGGNAELITDGISGFVAEAPSINAFSAAMERAWQMKSKWELIGKNANNSINNQFITQPEEKLFEILLKAGNS